MRTLGILTTLVFLWGCSEPDDKDGWQFNNQNNVNNINNVNNQNNTNNTNNQNNTNNSNHQTNINNTTGFPEPDNHRPEAVLCERERPPGSVGGNGSGDGECNDDADCTSGINGRCDYDRIGEVCSYDECFEDGDCETGVCGCDGGWHSENFCMRGNCLTDADCPDTGYCSPSFDHCGNYFGFTAYYCHTPEDECVNDSDCPDDMGFGPPYCMFQTEAQRWVCSYSHCVG